MSKYDESIIEPSIAEAKKWVAAFDTSKCGDMEAIAKRFNQRGKTFICVPGPDHVIHAIIFYLKTFDKVDDEDIPEIVEKLEPHKCIWDYYLFAFYESAFSQLDEEDKHEFVRDSFFEMFKAGLGHIVNLGDLIIGIPLPKAVINQNDQLHCEDGPAVEFADGTKAYWWNDVEVDREVIEDPDSVDPISIIKMENQEKKRASFEALGYDRILKPFKPEKIASDDWGTLYELEPSALNDDQGRPARFVRVVCPSTGRVYPFNRVPPNIKKPVEAIAARFGVSAETFKKSEHS